MVLTGLNQLILVLAEICDATVTAGLCDLFQIEPNGQTL